MIDASMARTYIDTLCSFQPHRRLGSVGNKAAVAYVIEQLGSLGYEKDVTPFECLDHTVGQVSLTAGGSSYDVIASSYTNPFSGTAELIDVSTLAELEKCNCAGKILLMRGELCQEQLMPKNFQFYNPDHHKSLYALLEKKAPGAIITATGKDLTMVGNIYPFNIFEDGDFDIPSVCCKDVIGNELAALAGSPVTLVIEAERIPTHGNNIILKRNPGASQKLLICAHIDTKDGTPGASDNGSGTVVLMLLARMLATEKLNVGLELVFFNGEDNYSVAGEMDYLTRYGDDIPNISMMVNIDDVGVKGSISNFSLYDVPSIVQDAVRSAFGKYDTVAEGPQWYAGDHMIFVQNGRPAMAITSDNMLELMATITHTPDDTPDNINEYLLMELAQALRDMVVTVDGVL